MDWLAANTPADPDDLVLDVAAGTAIYARTLAPRVAAVVAIDLTPEMLDEGLRAARAHGLTNIVFEVGDATALPFRDGGFDRVVSRLALHHFAEPAVPFSEMVRVCRPGGTITVVDMVVVDEAAQDSFNQLERRRDQAHTRALTRSELVRLVEEAGVETVHTASRENVIDGERWLDQTDTPARDRAFIRSAWSEELAGGRTTGMRPHIENGRVVFVHDWDLLATTKT